MNYIQKNEIDKVNEYLLTKGWNLTEMKQYGSLDDYNREDKIWPELKAGWSFNNRQGRTISMISYYHYGDFDFPENKGKSLPIATDFRQRIKSKEQVLITYTIYDINIFSTIKNKVEASNYKKAGNTIANNSLQTTYYNIDEIVRFTTVNKNNQQYFVIHLLYNTGKTL